MKAAIIGASEESLHTIEKAHELGLKIIALDGNPKAAGLETADTPVVVNISDESATLDVLEKLHPDFTLTVPIGRYLTTIGFINDKLNLPGIKREQAAYCTDKYLFHTKLAELGLRNCHCYLVHNGLSDDPVLNFPAILKPRFGSGSRDVYFINNENELNESLKRVEGEDYVLEECIAGDEYGFDAAIIDGTLHLILLRKKDNTPLPARQAVAYYSVNPKSHIYYIMSKYIADITSALELDDCLVHGDLIDNENGPFVIELSARPSGHNLHNLFTPLCTGVDMAEQYIRFRMGLKASFIPQYTKNMMIHYFDFSGTVNSVPTKDNICDIVSEYNASLVKWNCNIHVGDELVPVTNGHSLMSRGYYIIEFPNDYDAASIHELVSKIHSQFA